ncbi:MAG: hypothetical protein A3K19_01160 [Lentisphaerae bacterium RIFOXYB12_FULL_65_16]|nr:MAG: hypothetical protein A3K18_33720 [Lentisphaerae bacterium RIFOXYA12_64_32]OGV92500.1 MAG: hypothetical protein A3K19_01160 [Lentisphaerae bacterium RIFOXYB12_FULL_65_16]
MNMIETIRTFVLHSPFCPFGICLSDGASIPVRHPEMIALDPNGRSAIVYRDDGSFQILNPQQITRVEVTVNA